MLIEVGCVYHCFEGGYYLVDAIAEHALTGETVIVYHSLADKQSYVMAGKQFCEELDKTKYPNASQKHRFEKVYFG